jgi:hypothetical protein
MIVRPFGGHGDPLPQAPTLLPCPPGNLQPFDIHFIFGQGGRRGHGDPFPQALTLLPCPPLATIQSLNIKLTFLFVEYSTNPISNELDIHLIFGQGGQGDDS